MGDLEAMKAAFLAKGGTVSVAPPAVAYGIDRDIDRARRAAARDEADYRAAERHSENHVQRVREERGYYGS